MASKGKEVNLKKDGYFTEAGKVPKQVGFVLEGVVRGGYHNDKGEDITRCFISENSLVAIMSTTSRQAREAYGKIKITRQRRAGKRRSTYLRQAGLNLDYRVNFEANPSSSEYLQAITDCRLVVFSKQDWEGLSRSTVGWDTIKNQEKGR